LGAHLEFSEKLAHFDYSNDFKETQGAFTIIHRLDLDTKVSFKAAVSSMNFDGPSADYSVYDLGLGFTKAFSPKVGVSLGIGYYLQDLEQGIDNEDGLSGYLTLWTKDIQYVLSLEISKGYDEVYFDGEDLGFSHYFVIGGHLDYLLTNELTLNLETDYREDDFPRSFEDIKERNWGMNCKLIWKINDWIETSLGLSHWERNANEEDYEYRDNRLWLNITILKDYI